MKQHHPDAGGDDRTILALNAAWEVLRDAVRRRRHDLTAHTSLDPAGASFSVKRARAQSTRSAATDAVLQQWLQQVYAPIDRLLAQVINPFPAQLKPHGHRDKPTHAHNIYLELTAETGLIGLSGLLLAIALGWRWFALACQERQRMAAPYAATLLVMLFPLTTHTVLFAAFYFSLIIMILGGFLAALFSPESVSSTT